MSKTLRIDETRHAIAGRHIVQVTRIREHVYTVETLTAGPVAHRVDALSFSDPSETLARTLARIITVALRKDGATVDTARAAVATHIDAALDAMLVDGFGSVATAAHLQDVKAMVESAEDRQWATDLINAMNSSLGRVA